MRFFEGLRSLMPSSAVLGCVYPLPRPLPNPSPIQTLPATIPSLYQPSYKELTQEELEAKCEDIFNGLEISDKEAAYLTEATKLQSKSLIWFEHRKGRITASKFRAVCSTSITAPSQSLLKGILHTGQTISTAAMEWGIRHEVDALREFQEELSGTHASLKVKSTGLHVNVKYPHLGASPDGVVSCDCCGTGLIEVKCPYSIRNCSPAAADLPDSFYLRTDDDGTRKLLRTHAYYYQVQGQMAVCELDYSYFVCWTPCGLHVERIERDPRFFASIKPTLDLFFTKVVLPAVLLGDCSDAEDVIDPSHPTSSKKQPTMYCFCQRGDDYDDMIGCDNPSCVYEWYHLSCVGIETVPSGTWYCNSCKDLVHK